jgi:carbon-monoxide dehydrogenase medium subunit
MIPAPFTYQRVASVDDAISSLLSHGENAKLLAGGHSLIPLMKLRLATPRVLIDISEIPQMSGIALRDGVIHIGACARHVEVESSALVRQHAPLLAYTASLVGDPQVRNRGTIGGSVSHGDSASDLPVSLLALDARFVITGPRGERTVAASSFFLGFWQTALQPDENLTRIEVPARQAGWSYQKFTIRSQDWATVSAAVTGDSVALGAMADVPLRATRVEEALQKGASLSEAAVLADEGTSPSSDTRASADYRRHLARVLVENALVEAQMRH